ncbi:hypothetical protein OH77DRAFT_1518859 [Trametes cingulata]|nr:hypothetical protein OH77DRAFT_1518859 [Trametes cingulata]
MPSRDDPLKPSPPGRPRIWAATREELCQVIPEFARAENDIVFGSTETPVIFIEGDSWETERWDGGKTIELCMVREFTRALPESAFDPGGDSRTHTPWMVTTVEMPITMFSHMADPLPEVVLEDGLYRFVSESETPEEDGSINTPNLALLGASPAAAIGAPGATDWSAHVPTDGPQEIEALSLAKKAGMPVSIVLCGNATLAPFSLPEGCGCAFLGFFSIVDMQDYTEKVTWEATTQGGRPITLLYGRKTWRFRFDWTPGGEDLESASDPSSTPWWMTPSPPHPLLHPTHGLGTVSMQHPFTLLPLRFYAPPEQIVCTDADVKAWRGWHCTCCGKLNLQRNLCYQKCDSCSAPNGLPPISVEYVRQVRGTDPIAFPWDRHDHSVSCDTMEGPESLRQFTYTLGPKAFVHHMFTRNRPEPQEEPTRLFRDLQADVEFVGELGSSPGRAGSKGSNATGPYFTCVFGTSSALRSGAHASWPSEVPSSVSRARELMLRRGQVRSGSPPLEINCLIMTAWRASGNKKGCKFAAESSPVVLLCLGADVELTFWGQQETTGPAVVASSPPDDIAEAADEDDVIIVDDSRMEVEEELPDEADSAPAPARSVSAATNGSAPPKKKGKGGTAGSKKMELLMVTLVHGDMLVVHGAAFEYSMKRTGMSIVLVGQK